MHERLSRSRAAVLTYTTAEPFKAAMVWRDCGTVPGGGLCCRCRGSTCLVPRPKHVNNTLETFNVGVSLGILGWRVMRCTWLRAFRGLETVSGQRKDILAAGIAREAVANQRARAYYHQCPLS
jgi:hypothetical protein